MTVAPTNTALFAIPVAVGIVTGVVLAHLYASDVVEDHPLQAQDALLTASSLTGGGSPILGDPDAPITIVEWGDYQCTYCYLFHNNTLGLVIDEYVDTGKARMIFKDFALNGPDSALAAAASHCANDQSMYWEYHDELYRNWGGENTGWVTRDSLGSIASTVGLDMQEFSRCMDLQKHAQKVQGLYKSGQKIGIDATPSFIIFDDIHAIKVVGNQPFEVLVGAVERLKSDRGY